MFRAVPPRVTVIVPARNEAAHIEACVRSVLRQQVEGGVELLVVDGRSEDDTAALARRAGATVLDNPRRTIPAALNRGLEAAEGEVVVRFDAHAEMPPGYVTTCLEALAAEKAANVGGWREVVAAGPWGRAVGAALSASLGVGNARIWRRPAPGQGRLDVDTVPLGCFRRETLVRAGGWSERLEANEDYELNERLRRGGGRVVFDPAIRSVYRPRESFTEVARQYWRYGRWKAAMLRSAPGSVRPRQLAPPALVLAVAAAIVPSRLAAPARGGLSVYALAVVAAAARAGGGWRTPVVLTTMHLAWGAGLLAGLARPPAGSAPEVTAPSAGRAMPAGRGHST
jgi:cellulose synthase/poly-beta-1,6-N-acetylglucosamine synthase-like glycosyltransferase